MKKSLIIISFLSYSFCLNAQTGIGTTTPNASAKMDVSSTDKGFLPPRVALTSTSTFAPVTGLSGTLPLATAAGLLVYNTATAGTAPNNVVPGYYYWNGTAWVNFIASNTSTGLTNDQNNTTYTLTAADNGKIVTLNNSGAITLYVPYFFVGFNCIVLQKGTGQVTLTISGATTNIHNRYSFNKTAGQYSILTLVCMEANKYVASGDMTN